MGFEKPQFEELPGENSKENLAKGNLKKKAQTFFSRATGMVALGSVLLGGELKADDTKETSNDREPLTAEQGNKLADAKSLKKIRDELGVKEIKVESSLDEGHKWSLADAKVFQTLKEKNYFDGREERIGATINKLKEDGLVVKETPLSDSSEVITSSSGWAFNAVRYAEDLEKSVVDKEDAMRLINQSYNAFVVRFQNPNPALGDSINKTAEGKEKFTEWDRSGTSGDFRVISEQANKLVTIFEEVTKKHSIHPINIQTETDMLREISKKCADKAERK